MQIEQRSFMHFFWILGSGQGMGCNADRASLFCAFFLDIGQGAGAGKGVQYITLVLKCIFGTISENSH